MGAITHAKVSTVPDSGDTDDVQMSDWNDEHDHNLTASDVGADAAGTAASAVSTHAGAADPHTGYLKESDFTGVDFLVGTATGITGSEIAVGTTPGGELGGTWASPTVDGSHSGSTHAATQSAAEATAASAASTHAGAADPHTGYVLESLFDAAGDIIQASGDNTPAKLTKGSAGQFLQAGSSTLAYADVMIPVSFSKQGLVSVTTEGDTPPPFRWYNRSGRTLTFHSASANATIGPNGSTMTVDINVDGTTIMTGTKVVLPNNSAAASQVEQTTFSTTTIADDSYISVNVDTAGGGAVQNLAVTVWLKG